MIPWMRRQTCKHPWHAFCLLLGACVGLTGQLRLWGHITGRLALWVGTCHLCSSGSGVALPSAQELYGLTCLMVISFARSEAQRASGVPIHDPLSHCERSLGSQQGSPMSPYLVGAEGRH